MSMIDDAQVINRFRDIAVARYKDIMVALPALVPQSEKDRILFKKGMSALDELVYNMEHAENIRELSRYLDIQAILRDFDEDSIRTLDQQITNSARATVNQLSEMSAILAGDEYEDGDAYDDE